MDESEKLASLGSEVLIALSAPELASTFEELNRRYHGRVAAKIARNVRNPADWDDVAQEVWMKVWRFRLSIALYGNFEIALFRIVRQIVLRFYGIHHEVLDAEATPPDASQSFIEQVEDPESDFSTLHWSGAKSSDVTECLDRLPEENRAPIVLVDIHGLAPREAADLLGWKYGELWKRHLIGVRTIQWCLKAKGYHLGPTKVEAVNG